MGGGGVRRGTLFPWTVSDYSLMANCKRLARLSADELLGVGVPPDWLADVQRATEDDFLALADHLPAEAAEALLDYATSGRLRTPEPAGATPGPFAHPDAPRRFRVVENQAELALALDAPWERWIVFLHPAQQGVVDRSFAGPARAADLGRGVRPHDGALPR